MAKTRQTNVVINYVVNDADIKRGNATLQRASKATDDLKKNLDKTKDSSKGAGTAMKNAGDEGAKSFFNFGNVLKTLSFAIIAHQLLDLTKKIIRIRGEFQKFEAILTNTLGSRSAALIALGKINEFAKTTPYSVAELTNNFIKLANRGVEPTVTQMRAIADLSATLGKDYNQVVEAILDINNPERWKEIGVKAETAGNKVKLSFRDATIEVDRTVQGVTDAVVALGQLNGVAGSTEAISKTLAGQTNNLADAWEQVFNTLGQGNEGALFNTISLLSRAIEKANELLKGEGQKFTELTSKTLATEIESFQLLVTTFGDIDKASAEFSKNNEKRLKEITDRQTELMNAPKPKHKIGDPMSSVNEQAARDKELADLRDLFDIYNVELPKALEETIKKLREKAEIEEKASAGKAAIERLKTEAAESKKIGEQMTNYLEDKSNQEMFMTKETLKENIEQRKQTADREKEIETSSAEHVEYYRQLKIRKAQEAADEAVKIAEDEEQRKLKIQEQAAEQRIRIQQYLADSIIQTINTIAQTAFRNGDQQIQDEYDQLQEQYNNRIQLAGDNERLKMQLQLQFEKDKEAIDNRKAIQEKRKALAAIAMDTAVNAVKLFAQTIPPGILSAIAIAFGAVQAGIVSQQKFAKGVIDLQGPGTETSDSIHAMLSRRESVMTADETMNSGGILRSIRAKKLNDRVLKEIVAGRSGGGVGQRFDDSKILAKLDDLKNGFPDFKLQAGILWESKKKSDNYKQWIRSKTIGDF